MKSRMFEKSSTVSSFCPNADASTLENELGAVTGWSPARKTLFRETTTVAPRSEDFSMTTAKRKLFLKNWKA